MMLNQIILKNLRELENKKNSLPMTELRRMAREQPPPGDFVSALRGDGIRLIAEVKKASPSRGVICQDFDPVQIARNYAANGAAAISVLTESRYFQGSIEHLRNIKKALGNNRMPLLRKDFVLDPYQVYESRAYGADSLLLIVAILTPEKLQEFLIISHELGMTCLVEVHNEAEVEIALKSEARIIGINNRDLNTFKVDFATTERLRPLIPPDKIVVSESGIKDRNDIEKCHRLGINAVLVGESLMAAPDIAVRMKELLCDQD
jgi:indole-3-glycerol phosphate synthase